MYALASSVRDGFSRAKQDIEKLRNENQELRAMILEFKEGLRAQEQVGQRTIFSEPQAIQAGGDIKEVLRDVLAEMKAYQEKHAPSLPAAIVQYGSNDSLSRFDLDKKAVIKTKILEVIEHAPVMLPRLKEIIVDQNRYCSKASFYRYFEELKDKEQVSLVSMNSRNIVRSNRVEVYGN